MRAPWGHVQRRIVEYCDGRLAAGEAARVDAHLKWCRSCRVAVDNFHLTSSLVAGLPEVQAPDTLWRLIENALATTPAESKRSSHAARLLLAAALALITVGAAALWYSSRTPAASWEVARSGPGAAIDLLAPGEWLQTGASSRLRINVGTMGFVDVEPNSRVRLGPAGISEHRIELARGEISATISAPPRLFFVDTPASTVVDLGCAYTMRVNEGGDGRLRVTAGWASLEWQGREALVPAGASCRTRPGTGPGTPCFDDAPAALQQALDVFDFQGGSRQALDTVIAESRVRDTLTLWHLLSRVTPDDRVRIFDRMLSLAPLKAEVAREQSTAARSANAHPIEGGARVDMVTLDIEGGPK